MNSEMAIGNYLLDLYFGSFDIKDNEEHLYYKLTFMTADHVPIAVAMMNEAYFDMLLDCMEYLPENCGFGFDFQPSEPMVNYTLWVGLESEAEDALLLTCSAAHPLRRRMTGRSSSAVLILFFMSILTLLRVYSPLGLIRYQ